MQKTAPDRLQLGGWIRMAAALAILTMISMAPPYTGTLAIPDRTDAPATVRESPVPTIPALVAPAEQRVNS